MAVKDYDALFAEHHKNDEEPVKKEVNKSNSSIDKNTLFGIPSTIDAKPQKEEVPTEELIKNEKQPDQEKVVENKNVEKTDKKEKNSENTTDEIASKKADKNDKEPEKVTEKTAKDVTVDDIIDKITTQLSSKGYSAEEFRFYAREAIEKEIDNLKDKYSKKDLEALRVAALEKSGYGVLEKYLADDTITEIIVQRFNDIYIERKGIVEKTDAAFMSEEELQNVINKIVGQRGKAINYSHPIVDTTLFDGSRVAAQIPPVTPDGATMTIRKFSKKKLTMDDLLEFDSVTQEAAEFLKTLVRKKASIVISGGTGTGKTTILNILSGYIPKHEMIVTIEDTPELVIQSDRVRRMLTRESVGDEKDNIDIKALVKASLRMRPDRIIIGEVRGSEIREYFAGASTGHDGGILTIHSDSPKNLVNTRVPILYGSDVSEHTIRLQFSEAVDFIIQLKRYPDGIRKIVEIAYVNGMKGDEVNIIPVYKGNYDDDKSDSVLELVGDIPEKYKEEGDK